MLTHEQLKRVEHLKARREERELEADFISVLDRLHEHHYDLDDSTFNRWEGYLIDRDQLALGAAIAMMDVRDARNKKTRTGFGDVA